MVSYNKIKLNIKRNYYKTPFYADRHYNTDFVNTYHKLNLKNNISGTLDVSLSHYIICESTITQF